MSPVSWSRLIRFIPSGSSSPVYGEPVASDYTDIGALADVGKLEAKIVKTDGSGPLSETAVVTVEVVKVGSLLGPLSLDTCTDIKCIGLNYKKHIQEGGRSPPPLPQLFIKPVTSLGDYNEAVEIPKCAQEGEADYEAELVIVIGKDAKNVSKEDALDYVAGYTVGDDVSTRKWQRNPERVGGVPQWAFSKGFDKFAPLGPAIVSTKLIPDPSKLDIKLTVNGDLRQESPTSDLLFNVPFIISFLSQGTTLRRGTVIMTGTPSGVGCTGPEEKWRPLVDGDKVEVTISEIGTLRHTIKYE
ncbi:uncharacterized protein I303_101449 [Kwoniella dejecticola CBS 10117]|uniref:Fumarylacetoacetase-like C-terminal domain-containing protein n=1 Tax=Kwoniella dejecticola CBS 10117 TaxID=1296121 RepID=A0A1A6AHT6_9TREE|nr:uncharacterized protein I303_01458 [Kwoniella dejecticola CBS 10117]OBR89629.1 hypothetical protein I303_01458 [Kwoniella dejecticola CBS 10117]